MRGRQKALFSNFSGSLRQNRTILYVCKYVHLLPLCASEVQICVGFAAVCLGFGSDYGSGGLGFESSRVRQANTSGCPRVLAQQRSCGVLS